MDPIALAEKIRKIEALIAGAKSDGERQAAELAKERLKNKIPEQSIEYTICLGSPWEKRLFVALCCKHHVRPYRYPRQKHTTVKVRTTDSFINQILWPEYKKYSGLFRELAEGIIQDLTSRIHRVDEEDELVIAGELPSAAEVLA